MIATQVTSSDVVIIWQTFFICTAFVMAVVAICCVLFYGAESRREHEQAMRKLDIDLEKKRFDLQRAKNQELDLQLNLSDRDLA